MLKSGVRLCIALLSLYAGIAQAQRETVYMAILSSFRPAQNGDADPSFGLYVSTDRGLTWQHRGWREYIRTFYGEEGSDGALWSACGNGVLRSTDHGKSWRVTTGWEVTEVLKVKAAEKDPSLVFASTAYGIFRTTDRGETWEKKTGGMRRAFSGDVCIDRTDPTRILAATEEGVYLSEDRGELWTERGLAGRGVRVIVQDLHDAKRFWLGTEENGVYCSSDGGRHWESTSRALDGSAVYTIAMHPQKHDWLYAGTYGRGVLQSTDGGRHWVEHSRGLTDREVHALVVLPSDPKVILAGTLHRGLFRSTDSGETWVHVAHDSSQVWGLSVRTQGIITARDGKTMVLIPGGTFRMGSQTGYHEEAPVHSVRVTDFYMDQLPVTNREFRAFCDSTGTPYPANPRWDEMPGYFLDYPDHPVVNVTLEQASAYASWAGKRIPTEVEWEYAACGGLEQPLYPWGDAAPDGARAKFADRNSEYEWRDVRVATPWKYTAPAGSFAPNGYGLYDMAGNVYQWTTDWFFRYDDTVRDMSHFEDGWGGSRIVRGGCYYSNAFDLRVARRRQQPSGSSFFSIGFRCVRDAGTGGRVPPEAAPAEGGPRSAGSTAWRSKLDIPRMPARAGVRLCLGEYNEITPEEARRFRNAGFSSVEFYLTWESVESKGENQWDFSAWDRQVGILRRAGLKMTAFIIAGPAYSLPGWYRRSKDFVGLRCLEHNIESKTSTLWDPAFYKYVDRFLARVARQYGDSGTLEGVLLGISGDFGEAIFPVWHGGWPPTIAGLYHSHEGYWCGDPYARAAFADQMKRRFHGEIAALNDSWGTSFASFASVTPPPLNVDYVEGFRVDELTPRGEFALNTAQDRRRWVDFVDWYRASMTRHADEWMRLGRKYFPRIPVYLCTGGDADPAHGSNFADQCKVAAKYHGGIRITNETTDFGLNFTCTNWVTTASHLYGSQFGFEPAGKILDAGVVSRIYNAAASGVDEFMTYAGNIYDTEARMDLFLKYAPLIRTATPHKEGALLYPDLDIVTGRCDFFNKLVPFVSMVRDYSDILFADDRLIEDGVLHKVSWMIVFDARWFRKSTLERIVSWVESGGLLIAANTDSLCSAEDGGNYFPRLFNTGGGEKKVGKGATLYISRRLPAVREVAPVRELTPGEEPAEGSCEQYQSVLFDPATRFLTKHGKVIPDGTIDRVYTAIVDSTMVILNHTGERVVRKIRLSDTDIREISLEGNSIRTIPR